ncbi:MAG: hypothetical protein HHJ12_12995 [Glaciimonas sp.]|nr:hypothetical protein [Glaciimonas sp.]
MGTSKLSGRTINTKIKTADRHKSVSGVLADFSCICCTIGWFFMLEMFFYLPNSIANKHNEFRRFVCEDAIS